MHFLVRTLSPRHVMILRCLSNGQPQTVDRVHSVVGAGKWSTITLCRLVTLFNRGFIEGDYFGDGEFRWYITESGRKALANEAFYERGGEGGGD